jgi:hypothetical protein
MRVAHKQVVVTVIETEPPPAAGETVRLSTRLQAPILNQIGRARAIRAIDHGACACDCL